MLQKKKNYFCKCHCGVEYFSIIWHKTSSFSPVLWSYKAEKHSSARPWVHFKFNSKELYYSLEENSVDQRKNHAIHKAETKKKKAVRTGMHHASKARF